MNNLGGRRSRPLENVEISASERSALLPVVSMHCLVLYCYLLASTKRGNESEAGRATWPAGRAVIIILPHSDRPRPTVRTAAAVATHKLGGGAAQSRWYPRRCYLPLRLRRIPQFGQMAVGGKLVRSKTVATLWLLRAGSRGQQPLDGSIVNTSLLERKVDIPCERGVERVCSRNSGTPQLRVDRRSANGRLASQCGSACANALSRDRV